MIDASGLRVYPGFIDAHSHIGISEEKKTTDDLMFTVETVACLGACSSAPAITLNDEIYPTRTPESAVQLVRSVKENG